VVVAATARHWPIWAVLVTATLTWAAVYGITYLMTALIHNQRRDGSS
jgi:hypothetical protein